MYENRTAHIEDKNIRDAINALNNNVWDIRISIINYFQWLCENSQIRWFSFWEEYNKTFQENSWYNLIYLDWSFQATQLVDSTQDIEEIVADYIDPNYFCVEFWVDKEWARLELTIDDYT